MLKPEYPYYLANQAQQPNTDLEVLHKGDDSVATRVAIADAAALEQALQAADEAREDMAAMPPYDRAEVLRQITSELEKRSEELANVITVESGKTLDEAAAEVARAIDTFRLASEEATRIEGQSLELQVSPNAAGYRGFTKRVPKGACAFITPFNFPLNLVAHKVAPALAAGCPFILKPSALAPLSALIIGEILAGLELPEGAFSILPMATETAAPLVEDDRISMMSFTGSSAVGWELKSRAGRKHVVLELGGNAAVIVDKDVDLDDAVQRITTGIFHHAGQSCISVQRIYVHQQVYSAFRDKLVGSARRLETGDPLDEEMDMGPVITEEAALRIEDWVQDAVIRGATILCGGDREGRYMEPTLLENVKKGAKAHDEELFGPVACIAPFKELETALEKVNDSRYGLQAGIFTDSLEAAMLAWDMLEVGGVIVGDVPSWRVDSMPYGGTKDSGVGREGIRSAILEMTDQKLMVLRT
jgi:acyl-CoA reductase-like NAD-dependent aldehyde dehydrogenase